MKSTGLLSQDHKIILRALEVLQAVATRTERGEPVDAEDVRSLLRFLRVFADDYHQAKEESAFFPELMRACAANHDALRHMIFQHNQERSLVEGLEDALCTKNVLEFVYFADRLIQLISSHIQKEEDVMFDIAEQSLSVEVDDRVASQLEKFRVDPEILADLQGLEWKYLRRAAYA
jgi:hemerythrin-like domain-containing protein